MKAGPGADRRGYSECGADGVVVLVGFARDVDSPVDTHRLGNVATYEYKLISYDSTEPTEAALNDAAAQEFRFVTVIATSVGPALLLEREVPTK